MHMCFFMMDSCERPLGSLHRDIGRGAAGVRLCKGRARYAPSPCQLELTTPEKPAKPPGNRGETIKPEVGDPLQTGAIHCVILVTLSPSQLTPRPAWR